MCGSYGVIFENHTLGDRLSGIRNGDGYRLQCEGENWEPGLEAWIYVETERRRKEKESAKKAKKAANKAEKAAGPSVKKQKVAHEADPEEEEFKELKLKLRAGLDLLKVLAQNIHKGVLAINPEPDVATKSKWQIEDCSLLVSTPTPLEPWPALGTLGLPKETLRFPSGVRAKVPPEQAAPAAIKGGLLS